MTGFLPIFAATTGATHQTAPDAAATPSTGAEGAFSAILAEMSGIARADGEALLVADGKFALMQTAAQPAGSALQRLKLALADSRNLPIGFGMTASIATSMISLAPAATPADEPAVAADTPKNPDTANVAATPALPASAQPNANPVGGAGHQPATSNMQSETVENVRGKAKAQPVIDAGQLLPPAEQPIAMNRKPEADDTAAEAGTAGEPQRPAADTAAQADAPVNIAYPVDIPTEQPAVQMAGLSATHAVNAPATNAAAPQVAGADVSKLTAETANSHSSDAPAVPEAEAQPDGAIEQHDLPIAQHNLTDRGTTTSLLDRVTVTNVLPVQAPAQPNAAAAVPPSADVAALAAIAPAAGATAAAPRALAAEQRRGSVPLAADVMADSVVTSDAPASGPSIPAPTGANTDAQASGKTEAAKIETFGRQAAEAPQQPAFAPAMADKPAATGNSIALADKPAAEPMAANEQAQPAQRQADEAQPAQPKADAKADTAQPAQADRPAVMTAEAPASQQAALPEGLQSINAHQITGHTQGTANAARPHTASELVKVATPQQVPEAVAMAISRNVGAESTEFTVRLDPAELGRVEVKLELAKDGQAIVSIQADNASTFDLLRRDSQMLERALAEAGLKLDSGGLNFSLRQQAGQNQQQFAGEGGQRQATGRMQEASLAGSEQDNTPRPTRRSNASGLLDLSI